ncbi:MAG: N-acetyltransferase family protein [Bacteroidota bacterium]
MTCTIRTATETDMAGILAIVNYAIKHYTAIYLYEPQSMEDQVAWFRNKQAEGWPVLVAEEAGKILGFGTFGRFRARPAYQYSAEHSVYVAHDAQGKGIGKALLSELIQLAKERGLRTLIAGVDSENEGSYQFHLKMGFKEVAHFKEVGYKFDRWLGIRFLQLWLEGPLSDSAG